MSTYIVAFANGSFAYIEDSYTSPLSQTIRPLRIYGTSSFHRNIIQVADLLGYLKGTPDLIGQARFSLDVTKKVLPLYEQLFGIEYPLPKLDTLIVSAVHFTRLWLIVHRPLTSLPEQWRIGASLQAVRCSICSIPTATM